MRDGGGGNTENLLFAIETDARLDAVRQARSEFKGLGEDAKTAESRANAALAAGGTRGGAGVVDAGEKRWAAQRQIQADMRVATQAQIRDEAALATTVNRSIGEYIARGRVVDRTSAEAVAAYRREGDALSVTLSKLGAMESELNAIGAAAQRVERQSGAIMGGAAMSQRGPAFGLTRGTFESGGEEFGRLSPRVMTAANALTSFSLAATSATGSAQQMILGLGTMAMSVGMLSNSARVAASATGIGALVVVFGTLLTLVDRWINEAPQAAALMERMKGAQNTMQSRAYLDQIDRQLSALSAELEKGGTITRPIEKVSAEFQALTEVRRQAYDQWFQMDRDQRKQAEKDAAADHKHELEEARRHAKEMADERIASSERIISMRTRVVANTERFGPGGEQREALIEAAAETQRKLRELDRNELLSAAEKERERAAIVAEGESNLARIRGDFGRREAEEAKRREDELQRARLTVAKRAVTELTRSAGSLSQALKRAALEPIVSWLEGTAAEQIVDAAKSAAALDFGGAARHAGVAALAIATARRLSAGAGLSGGGGGGSGAGGGGGGTFTPSARGDGAGSTVINLYTRNPYGQDEIAETIYYVNRANVLKRPIVLPPTTGFVSTTRS